MLVTSRSACSGPNSSPALRTDDGSGEACCEARRAAEPRRLERRDRCCCPRAATSPLPETDGVGCLEVGRRRVTRGALEPLSSA